MSLTIKNWKLLILALLLITLFIKLGFWQLSRAQEKEQLLAEFAERQKLQLLTSASLNSQHNQDLRFYRATLTGYFDNAHTFLLDNKIVNGRIGYEVYTPFWANGLSQAILIDRGFIPATSDRQLLPSITQLTSKTTISGLINLPPKYVALGQIQESSKTNWPLRIEYVNLNEISKILNRSLFTYLLALDSNQTGSYEVKWQIVIVDPARHRGYALQWFAFALTLVVLSVALNRVTKK